MKWSLQVSFWKRKTCIDVDTPSCNIPNFPGKTPRQHCSEEQNHYVNKQALFNVFNARWHSQKNIHRPQKQSDCLRCVKNVVMQEELFCCYLSQKVPTTKLLRWKP